MNEILNFFIEYLVALPTAIIFLCAIPGVPIMIFIFLIQAIKKSKLANKQKKLSYERYYHLWKNKLDKAEKTHTSIDESTKKQIERSFKEGLITASQFDELIAQCDYCNELCLQKNYLRAKYKTMDKNDIWLCIEMTERRIKEAIKDNNNIQIAYWQGAQDAYKSIINNRFLE